MKVGEGKTPRRVGRTVPAERARTRNAPGVGVLLFEQTSVVLCIAKHVRVEFRGNAVRAGNIERVEVVELVDGTR